MGADTGTIVLVESLSWILGAAAPVSVGLEITTASCSILGVAIAAVARAPVLGALPVLTLSLSSLLAAFENDLARFLKKFDVLAIIPLPSPAPPLPALALEETEDVLGVAWICCGRGMVFNL